MKSAVPKVSQTARLLLQSTDVVTGSFTSSNAVSNALRATAQYATFRHTTPAAAPAAAGDKAPDRGKPATDPLPAAAAATNAGAKSPGPGNPLTATTQLRSPPPSAAAAAKQKTPAAVTTPKPAPPSAAVPGATASPAAGSPQLLSGSSGGSSNNSGGGSGSSGGGGKKSSWLGTAALIAVPAGTYYYYQHQRNEYDKVANPGAEPSRQSYTMPDLESILNSGRELVTDIKNNIPDLTQISNAVKNAGRKVTDLTSRNDKLQTQKPRDEEPGFKMLPPEGSGAAAAAASDLAAADDAAAASAAARDSMSAAADEFPGSTAAAAATTKPGSDQFEVEHVDMSPITALFAEIGNTDYSERTTFGSSSSKSSTAKPTTSSSSKTSSASRSATADDASRISSSLAAVAAAQQQVQQQQQQAPAPAAAAAEYRPDSELDQLCRKLGLKRDLSPSGLIGAANAAGLGAHSSSGTPLPAQVAQLNQASADARLLGDLLNELAARRDELQQQLQTAAQEKQWAEESSKQREASLTEHFKELLREQSRIQAASTAQAVKEAEEVLLADLTAAQLEERKQRLAVVDELRAKVNALSLAFDQRTSQIRSAGGVNKLSIGVLALSKALEEGTPLAQQLQDLAIGCPDDPVVAALASSLPSSAATDGLPTLQQLQHDFGNVATAAAEAAYFSEGEGGVLARAAAKLAVRLKVNAGITGEEGPDKHIQQARALLQQGKVLAAADALSAAASGTQAAAVVQQWVAAARARAVADQAVQLLQAHATTIALAAKV